MCLITTLWIFHNMGLINKEGHSHSYHAVISHMYFNYHVFDYHSMDIPQHGFDKEYYIFLFNMDNIYIYIKL